MHVLYLQDYMPGSNIIINHLEEYSCAINSIFICNKLVLMQAKIITLKINNFLYKIIWVKKELKCKLFREQHIKKIVLKIMIQKLNI